MSTERELNKDNLRDTHWLGIVIDNADPRNWGRCKIKVYGKFDELPDEAIPWATPMNRDNVGASSIPRIGDILSVRFDNGNLYHPEYWFHVNQNKELKSDIIDHSEEPENVTSLVYDARRNLRIYHSKEDGLVITIGDTKNSAPMIRLADDGKIFINSNDIYIANNHTDDSEPAVRGNTLQGLLDSMLNDMLTHTHPTPVGPTGPVLPGVSITANLNRKMLDNNKGIGFIQQTTK